MKSKRVIYIDVIRVVAMMLVVLAHACSTRILAADGSLSWAGSNVLVGISEVAVPMFFMISGATILNSKKTNDVSYLYKHRLPRVIIPFVIWSIISAYPGSRIDQIFNLHKFLVTVALIFHQPVLTAYWFIYSLFGLYLISPFLKVLVDHMSQQVLKYLMILWMVINVTLPAIVQFAPEKIGNIFSLYPMAQIILSSYLGYFVLGYLLTNAKNIKVNYSKYLMIILALLMYKVAVRFIPSGSVWYLLNILSPIMTPVIAGLIYIVLKSGEGHYSNWFTKVIEFISPLTYGIYLVHGLVIEVVQKFISGYNYIGLFGVGLILSVILIFILSKIPVVNKFMI